jgi:hypothetical protein
MSSAKSSEMYKYLRGSFPILTTLNYAMWKGNMHRILQAILAWNIVDGTECIPPLEGPRATPAERSTAKLQGMNYIQHCEDAATVIYNVCSVSIHIYIDDIDDPEDIWLTLGECCNMASTAVG